MARRTILRPCVARSPGPATRATESSSSRPARIYLVTGKLVVPRHTTLRGEARDLVWIKVPAYWPKKPTKHPEFDSVLAGNGAFAVEDLSIVAQSVKRIIAAPDVPNAYGSTRAAWFRETSSADDVHLRRLRIQHLTFAHRLKKGDPRRQLEGGAPTIAVKGADFSLEDSVVISPGMPIQIAGADRVTITRNVLRTGRNGWYCLQDPSDSVFEENDIAAADLEGGYGGVQGSAVHVAFRGNHWHDAYGDEREALTFDTPYFAAWMGPVVVDGSTLILGKQVGGKWLPEPTYSKQMLAIVAGGCGVGQAVPVRSISETSVTLEHPFAVPPDAKSLVIISARKDQMLIVENHFEDASVAAQLYAQSREFVIAGNHCRRTGGSYAHASDYLNPADQRRRFSYALFNQWIDNTFDEGFVFDQGPWAYGYVGYTSSRTASLKESTPAIGNRFLANRLLGGTRLAATVPGTATVPPGAVPVGRDGIFERNSGRRQPVGITIDSGHADTLLRGNQFEQVNEPVVNKGTGTLVQP